MLNEDAENLASKNDKKNGLTAPKENTISINKELLKMIVYNLGMVQSSQAMITDAEAGSALKDTINVLNQNLSGKKWIYIFLCNILIRLNLVNKYI